MATRVTAFLVALSAITASITAQQQLPVLALIADDVNDVGPGVVENVVLSEDCHPDAISQCLFPLTSLSAEDDDDDEKACEVARATYNCLKNKADQCLDSPARTDVQQDLDQMKNLLTSKCDLKETNPLSCITEQKEKLNECASSGVATVVLNFRKTGENDFERFQCWVYEEMLECFLKRVMKNCGLFAVKELKEELRSLPPQIKESCQLAKSGQTVEKFFDFYN